MGVRSDRSYIGYGKKERGRAAFLFLCELFQRNCSSGTALRELFQRNCSKELFWKRIGGIFGISRKSAAARNKNIHYFGN